MAATPVKEGDGKLGITHSHRFSGLRRTDNPAPGGLRRTAKALTVATAVALGAAACANTTIDAGNSTGLKNLARTIDNQGVDAKNPFHLNNVPGRLFSVLYAGLPDTIDVDINGHPEPETDNLAEIHSPDNSGAVMPLAFATSSPDAAKQKALFERLQADLAEPHPLAVTLSGKLFLLDSGGSGGLESKVVLEVDTLNTVNPTPASSKTSALGRDPMREQSQTNQLLYRRPQDVYQRT